MKELYKEFVEIYKDKPIKDNTGGMKSPQMFGLFCILKKMNPKLIIESGVWYGQGTWFMRKVCPKAKIISFDINLGNQKYKDKEAEYHENDITSFDWDGLFRDNPEFNSENSLLFLDDHIDFSTRLSFVYHNSPFKYLVYEDNYPPSQGDCVSPKKILECTTCVIDRAGGRTTFKIPSEIKESFTSKVKIYEEMPPICKPTNTRWGDEWEESKYPTPDPVFNKYDEMEDWVKEESQDYTWICFMELNK
jgi:hypothetical protein